MGFGINVSIDGTVDARGGKAGRMSDFREWLADVLMCTPDELPPPETRLRDLEGWDSIRHVGLIVGLERQLNEKLTAEQIQGIVTLGDVSALLRPKAVDA